MGTRSSRPQQTKAKPSSQQHNQRVHHKKPSGAAVGPQTDSPNPILNPMKKSKEYEDRPTPLPPNIMKTGYDLKPSDTCMW